MRVSPDLSIAKAYLSVFPSEQAPAVMENINKSRQTVRYELAHGWFATSSAKVPELQFYLDDSLDYIDNINSLLEK